MSVKVEQKIIIEVEGTRLELSESAAKELYYALDKKFGKRIGDSDNFKELLDEIKKREKAPTVPHIPWEQPQPWASPPPWKLNEPWNPLSPGIIYGDGTKIISKSDA